jgi:hypothetical protein
MYEWPTRVRTAVPPGGADRLGDGPAADEIVDHRPPGLSLEEPTGGHRGDGAAVQGPHAVIDEEGPVGVAVERDTEVRGTVGHGGLEVLQILGAEGIGMVVGEGPVGLEVQAHERGRNALEDGRDGHPRHPVASVDHHRGFWDRGGFDDREKVVDVPFEQVDASHLAPLRRGCHVLACEAPHIVEAAVRTDRCGAREAQLDAVVPLGIV